MEKFKQKLSSRKLWVAITTILSGILMIFGWSTTDAETVSGACLIIFGAIGYMASESKVDAARIKDAVDAAEQIVDVFTDDKK